MKALLRNPGETVTEDAGIPGIEWGTGYPLTSSGWVGGPYILVNDYVPPDPEDDFMPVDDGTTYGCINPSAASQPADAPAQDPPADTVVVDGVIYTRAP